DIDIYIPIAKITAQYLAELLDIREILGRDLGDRDVVDVDVLLADQIQQQVERTFINAGDSNRKREVVGFSFRSRGCTRRHGSSRSRRKIVGDFGVFRQCEFTALLGRWWAL